MPHSLTHRLQHAQTGKTSTLALTTATLTTTTSQPGRERTTEKTFATVEEARKQFEKKEWELLKKGFVLRQPTAPPGQPRLHYYVGAGYTGCLALAGTPQGIYVYKHGWYRTAHDQADFLVRIDEAGQLLETIQLPQVLPWQVAYNDATNTLLLNLDHCVYEYRLATGKFEQLTQRSTRRGVGVSSLVAVGPRHLLFATEPTLHVQTLDRQPLLALPYATKVVGGDNTFAAALAKNGKLLALHTKEGEIQLRQTIGGALLATLTGDFERVQQLEFVADDTLLAVRAQNRRSLLFLRILDGQPVDLPWLEIPNMWRDVQQFCFSPDETRLVLVRYTTAYVFDFQAKCLLHSFALQHTVKRAEVKFMGENLLGVRTDYGCFSLYAV